LLNLLLPVLNASVSNIVDEQTSCELFSCQHPLQSPTLVTFLFQVTVNQSVEQNATTWNNNSTPNTTRAATDHRDGLVYNSRIMFQSISSTVS